MSPRQAPNLPAATANEATGGATTDTLSQHAEAIRAAGASFISKIVEVGYHLTEAKKLCGHGNWLAWLDHEFQWSEETARRYMQCYELVKSHTVPDLDLPLRTLYLLARPSTPDAVRQEMLDRAVSGEELSHTQVKAAVDEAKQAKPKPRRPSYIPDAEKPQRPAIRQNLIDAAMKLIREMREADFDTWQRFDRIYQKARDKLSEIAF